MVGTEPQFNMYWDDVAGVAVTEWINGIACELAEARRAIELLVALGQGRSPLLVDMRGIASLDRPARQFFMNQRNVVSSIALLAGTPMNRMLANFFIGLRRMNVPVRMFTSRSQAMTWLNKHR